MINSPDTEKRKRQEINNKRSQATVHIGAEIERWNKLRKETGVSKHEDLCFFFYSRPTSAVLDR